MTEIFLVETEISIAMIVAQEMTLINLNLIKEMTIETVEKDFHLEMIMKEVLIDTMIDQEIIIVEEVVMTDMMIEMIEEVTTVILEDQNLINEPEYPFMNNYLLLLSSQLKIN